MSESMERNIQEILQAIGENPERQGLKNTPKRFSKALRDLTRGYRQSAAEVVNGALFDHHSSEIVLVRDIELYSLCEHHMLPFFGKAHVGYLPQGKIIGISKIARVVDVFARRLQVQENLTTQISEALMEILKPLGVGVVIEANHLCMMMRGVEKQNSRTITSSLLGEFRNNSATRKEFFDLIQHRG